MVEVAVTSSDYDESLPDLAASQASELGRSEPCITCGVETPLTDDIRSLW
jgi:hypothetical protein